MATKKKTKSKTTGKKKVGAAKGGDLQVLGGGLLGAIAARFIIPKIPLDAKISSVIVTIGGYLLAGRGKSPLLKGVGMGLFIGGGSKLVGTVVPALAGVGVGNTVRFNPNKRNMSGFYDVPSVGQPMFPKPASVGQTPVFPKPSTVGRMDTLYAGVYGY